MAWDPDLGVEPNDLRLVDASAGSGKTYTLMNLVGELIEHENEDAGCILATTFTNKAAAELRQRIRGTLLGSDRPDASKWTHRDGEWRRGKDPLRLCDRRRDVAATRGHPGGCG